METLGRLLQSALAAFYVGALDDPESLERESWKEQILQLAHKCFQEVDKEDWTISVGGAMQAQLPLYNSYPEDKCTLLQLLGVVMKKVANKQFVNGALDKIFEHVNHTHPEEREDFTGDNYHEKLLATVVLSYGHVSLQAPASILTTRVETPILRSAAKFYQASKDPSVRQAMLHTVRMIADAVHPDRLQEAYTFHSRGELVTQMRVMLKAENPTIVTTTTRALVLQALASLVKLEPVLPPSERVGLVETAVSRVYSLPSKNPSLLYDEAINGDELKDYPELVILSLSALDQFLAQLLFKDRSPDNFQLMIKVLIPWLTSKQEFERERCLNSIWKLMSFYCDHIEIGVFQIFSCFGFVLGLLVPRCTDPSLSIRNTALKCVQFSLEINNKSQSLSSKDDSDIHLVEELQPIIQRPDPDSLYSVTQGLAKIIAQKVQSIQLLSLTTSLMLGLTDPISQSSAGASVVLTGVIKLRGGELRAEGVCAVQEIFRVAEMEGCTREVFGHVFSALLLVAASYVGIPALPAQPSGDPKGATGDHSKLVPLRLICQHCPRHVPAIITSLHSSLATQKDSQRVAVVALFTEFLAQSFPGSQPLVEPLMGDVLGRLVDPCLAVRRLCIRGLAWVGRAEGDLVHRYSGTVLSAMISGMDDKDDSEQKIMLEAVNGLTTLLAQADEHDVSSFIVTVSLRLRNMFEKDKAEVRAAAFKLFGDLAKFGHGECKDAFIEQAMNNFITLLVHLNEDDRQVVKVNDFEEHMANFVTLCLGHLKSPQAVIQCNAALLLGFLLGNAPAEMHDSLPYDRVCAALIVLLKADTVEQRTRAAEALSLLHNY
ncbi:hypothetical protein HPB47_021968 [Ixodes persulcatus]|uniref:Uncharacterized protein n=1 Tax=Ixodes persulcatus TaxID=34615 RepID=A0AC60QB07_IXOPE|nr:hypothetical protein HPB47_021968 [Ixodes persulcatus]